jgi:O-antigen ligase
VARVSTPRNAAVRHWLAIIVAVLLAAAVLAPSVRITATLVNFRVELLLWAATLPYLIWAWIVPAFGSMPPQPAWKWVITGIRRLGLTLIDVGFLALAIVTLLSILHASLRLGERASLRDGFELVKLGLYWLAFRTALIAAAEARVRWLVLASVLIAGGVSALLGLAQYFDWFGVVGRTGHWWAEAHHLRALEREGRSFGTVGNPNYFGALMAMLAVVAMHARAASSGGEGLPWWLGLGVAVLASVGVVLSGSRGALALLIVAATAPVVIALVTRSPPGPFSAALLLAAAVAGAIGLVEAFPRGREDYLTRVAGALSPGGDDAIALRLERWRGALLGSGGDEQLGESPLPAGRTGQPSIEAAATRDAVRRTDLQRLVDAVRRHHDATGALPTGPSLDPLVPAMLATLPLDPADGRHYRYERTATGFTVAAPIEDPADPDYPLLAMGDVGNYIENGDLERGDGDHADGFRALPGTAYRIASEAALFGQRGLVYGGSRPSPSRRAAVYQQRAFGRTGVGPFTATLWLKFPAATRGEVFLYTNVFYGDGERQDPYARVAADSGLVGVWQRLSVTISPEPHRRVDFVGVYLLSDDFQGEVYADGFQLVDGTVPVTFVGLRDAEAVAPSGLDVGAQLRRSPVFGAGPRKSEGSGTLDNEYLLVAGRYGLAGLTAYLFLWIGVAVVSVRARRRGNGIALALVGIVAGLLLFNIVAGSLYQLQIMALFWPLAGILLATPEASSGCPT